MNEHEQGATTVSASQTSPASTSAFAPFGVFAPAMEYMVDAAQRSVLFWDVMRQRGNQYREHLAETAPHVLDYEVELLIDGRTLDRPVNYCLVKVVPPSTVELDPTRRPFVIVDPRAGHGPGIGGFKADSEIGVAFKAGHPCYFVGFLPDPMPGQTIGDVARAEAVFLEKVIALHPEADGKPCVVGNCQAGWAIMMLAAIRPELFGPIIIAGSPLSYWAGRARQEPYALQRRSARRQLADRLRQRSRPRQIRWRLAGAEFREPESRQHPVDQAVQSLFQDRHRGLALSGLRALVGRTRQPERGGDPVHRRRAVHRQQPRRRAYSNLGRHRGRPAQYPLSHRGVLLERRQRHAAPAGAGWILDLYESVDEIRSYGQTIVYTIHESVGHLGIFVSGGVAKKEHGEFSSNIDLIDTLPPGLYEAVFDAKAGDTANPDLAAGNWVMRCEARTLDDIRALGGNDAADERRFATAARVSETNLALYRTFAQPMVRALVSSPMAEWMHQLHPLRLQYELCSDANPAMASVAALAEQVRKARKPVNAGNPLVALQENVSRQIVTALDAWRDASEAWAERTFLAVYGMPALQAAFGIDPAGRHSLRSAPRSPLHRELLEARIAELKSRIPAGGLREAVIRALLYVGMARASVDERGFEAVRRIRRAHGDMPLSVFKSLVRAQFNMLLVDQNEALAAIPAMLPPDRQTRLAAFELVGQALGARGEFSAEDRKRMNEVARLFGVDAGSPASPNLALVPSAGAHGQAKVS